MFELLKFGGRAKGRSTYRIADRVFEITSLWAPVHVLCREYECEEECEPEYIIASEQEDIEAERILANKENLLEGLPEVQYDDGYLETTAVYRKIADALIDDGVILYHGSVIAVDGQGYLFTAKSGTGKSTHTALWRERFGERAVMVNDDKPLLRVKDGQVIVYGTPWNGKHRLGNNISVPLKALCILERAEKNTIERVEPSSVLSLLMQQVNRISDPAKFIKTMDILEQILKIVPVYRLKCNMDPEAAKVSYEGMQEL